MNGRVEGRQTDVLLVLPPLYQSGRPADYNPKEPMGIMCLASNLRKEGFSTGLFDADIETRTIKQTVEEVRGINAPVTGFSVSQRALPSLELVVRELRNVGYKGHITCGGITPTLSYPYILDRLGDTIDSVVLGEGEKTMVEIADRVINGATLENVPGLIVRRKNEVIVNKPVGVINLDEMPWPARDYLEECSSRSGDATIMGSRDCYGRCTFCSNYAFASQREGGRPMWRPRDPRDVIDEMQEIAETKGIEKFKFNDPNIFGPGKRGRQHVRDMCNILIERKLDFHLMGFCRGNDITAEPELVGLMKRAGFERLLIGIESSDNRILRKFGKGETIESMETAIHIVESNGLSVVVGFMIFNPYTTLDSLKNDLVFLKKHELTPTLSKSLRVFDGTTIQGELERDGRLLKRNPFEGYHDYVMPPEVAGIYGAMKVFFRDCLDRIRAQTQDKIWNIKKTSSFRDRQDFNSLSEAFFDLESGLLESFIGFKEGEGDVNGVTSAVHEAYQKLILIGNVLDVDILSIVVPEKEVTEEVCTILTEKTWNTLLEEYRWNQD